MRISNVQQTSYKPQFNGYIRLTNLKSGVTKGFGTSDEADKLLSGMFKDMTARTCFEDSTFDVSKNKFAEYCDKASELTGINEFKNLTASLTKFFRTRSSLHNAPNGGRYYLVSDDGNFYIFHSYYK